MDTKISRPVHESYLKHRKQVRWQIILPVVLTALFVIGVFVMLYIATFRGNGDVSRWAQVSTIWIVIPIMIGMVIFFALLLGMIYLIMKLLNIAPTYTGLAQDYVNKAAVYIKRGTDMAVKPIFAIDGLGASIKAFFSRK
jgi:ABC-type multidrug transport system fused ATPase/permease subunit